MSDITISDEVFAFELHLRCGGYAYFSTVSKWDGKDTHGREKRKPRLVRLVKYAAHLTTLGHRFDLVRCITDYQRWLLRRGWAFVDPVFARASMPQWFKAHACLSSPFSTYTACDIAAPSVLKHHASGGRRTAVLERDRQRCLRCGRHSGEVPMTMQHVVPYSKGGETSSTNLVVLCDECNAELKDLHVPELFDLAGLPHGLDPALLNCDFSAEAVATAMMLSDNLMHARCDMW